MANLHSFPNPVTALAWLLMPLTVLVLGRLLFVSVRWLRADPETRVSLRQARRIRRTWRRLAPMADLAVKDATPTTVEQLRSDGTPVPAKVRIPRISTRADAFGVTVTANTLPRVGLEAWQDAADDLCNGWGMLRIKVTQPRPGTITARGYRREPLDALIPSPLLDAEGAPARSGKPSRASRAGGSTVSRPEPTGRLHAARYAVVTVTANNRLRTSRLRLRTTSHMSAAAL